MKGETQQQSNLLVEKTELSVLEDTTRKIPPRLKLQKLQTEKNYNDTELSILLITWNLMGTLPADKYIELLLNKQRLSNDLIIIGTQQCQRSLFTSFFCESKDSWETLLTDHLQQDYTRIGSDVLQGLHTIAFVRKSLYNHVSDFRTNKIKTGFLGIVGNKELEFKLGDKHFLFINTHLQAMQEEQQRRNHDLLQIVHRLIDGQPADQIFFFGDLNYRISITLEEARKLNSDIENYKKLLDKDQLVQQENLKTFLNKYKEWPITFPPSYKMSTEKNTYNNNRIPGWTDRIFHSCLNDKEIEQTSYECDFDVLGSDHRPIIATFRTFFHPVTSKFVEVRMSQSRCSIM